MTELEKLKKLTGEKDEELLQVLMEDATAWVLAYTNRTRAGLRPGQNSPGPRGDRTEPDGY